MADDNPKLCECGCGLPARNRFVHGHNGRGMKRDISGQRFGRLVATKPHAANKHRRWNWEFVCDCGNAVVLDANVVTTGNTKSCGCFRSDYMRSAKTTHGKAHTPTHECWSNMRRRCGDPKNKSWPSYGGRGIKVCDRWKLFKNFLSDMGERPPGLTLERLDNDGPYSPENCAWRSLPEQMRNQQKTIKVEHMGKTMCLSEWARELGLNSGTITDRYHRGDRPPRLFRSTR